MKKKINLTLDKEVIEAVKKLAKERHSNFSATMNQVLWEQINGAGKRIADIEAKISKWEHMIKSMTPELIKLQRIMKNAKRTT